MSFQFKACSKQLARFLKAGAEKRYNMQYQGIVKTGTEYDDKEVGPAAWTNKEKTLALLLFEGDGQAEYALVQQDPEAEDVVQDFMGDYGHSLTNLLSATAVHFTTSAAGDGGSDGITPEGKFSYGYGNTTPYITLTGSDVASALGHGVDTPNDDEFVTVSDADWSMGQSPPLEQLSASLSGNHIAYMRARVRMKSNNPTDGLCLVVILSGIPLVVGHFFTDGSGNWQNLECNWFDILKIGADGGYGEKGMAYGYVYLHRIGGNPVDVSEIDVEFTSI